MKTSDRRRFTRAPFSSETIITARDIRVRGMLENLSLKGAMVKVSEKFPIGLAVEVEIFLAEPASDLSVVIGGTVARHAPDGVAIEFSGMYLDGYERLRDVVANSLGDRRKVVEEFLEYMAR